MDVFRSDVEEILNRIAPEFGVNYIEPDDIAADGRQYIDAWNFRLERSDPG